MVPGITKATSAVLRNFQRKLRGYMVVGTDPRWEYVMCTPKPALSPLFPFTFY